MRCTRYNFEWYILLNTRGMSVVVSTEQTEPHDVAKIDSHLFCTGFMFYLCYLYLFTYTGVQHDFNIRWCSCRLTVTWQMSHVEQELLTLPQHLISPPVFCGVGVARSLAFSVVFCRSLFALLYLFLLAIVLSVLRFTDFYYPFGISKLFFQYIHRHDWTILLYESKNSYSYTKLL